MTWRISQTVPTLAVPDLPSGVAFYDRLGFARQWSFPREVPTHVGVTRDGFELVLCRLDPAVKAELTFVVDDVAAVFAAVEAARPWELAASVGAADLGDGLADGKPPASSLRPPEAPVDQPYGYREFTLVDPWGHRLHFAQKVR